MMQRKQDHAISGVFVFLLLGVFAVFGTLLVLFGAQAYRGMTVRTAEHNEERLLTSFIRHAVHAQDVAGGVSVEEHDGNTVLVIRDSEADPSDQLASYIYVEDNMLYELYTDGGYRPGVGEAICSASSFEARIEDGLLMVTLGDMDGMAHHVAVTLYSAQ